VTDRALCGLVAAVMLALPGAAFAAPASHPSRAQGKVGNLVQLEGPEGCLVDRSTSSRRCTPVRALRGPAPFLGSNAVAVSPDARNVYVASSRSSAIAVFERNRRTGELSQRRGAAGCIAAGGRAGCATAVGLEGPNSVAVSPDGKNVYATSVGSSAVATFTRDQSTGALTQAADGSGCIANAPTDGCTTGRALEGADVVAVSPDGSNVYVGAFIANAVAVFDRDPATGALAQPADNSGCVVDPIEGCTTGLGLRAPEGMALSADGRNVYVATALSNALLILDRDPSTGALTQALDGSGCIANSPSYGCTTGVWLEGANAVAVSPDDGDVYVTSLLSNSLTSFTRTSESGDVAQKSGTAACVIYVLAVGCSLGRAFEAPEGLAAAPDGKSVYAAAFDSDAIGVLERDPDSGALIQKSNRAGCVTATNTPDCRRGRALKQVSSLAVSPDGRYLYAAAFGSDAVTVFRRTTRR
jgi:DNA-binding beta-propeller fold protein YncE